MFIHKLKIKNFRNFESFEIELKPLTLIIGENNVGKTNLLCAIGLIFSQDITFFKKRILEREDFNYNCIKLFKESILDETKDVSQIIFPEVKVEVLLKDFNLKQQAIAGNWFTNGNYDETNFTYSFSLKGNFNKVEYVQNIRTKLTNLRLTEPDLYNSLSDLDKLALVELPVKDYIYQIKGGLNQLRIDYSDLNFFKFELIDALRDAKNELKASNNNKLLFRVLYSRSEITFQELVKELTYLKNKVNANQSLITIKESIEDFLEKISLNSASNDNKITFSFLSPELEDILKKIDLLYGDSPANIERNGLGRNNLLFMSLLLSHCINLLDDNTLWRLIAVEEPESHLHPHLQNHFSDNIESFTKEVNGDCRKDIQVILTSHSTHISTKIDFDNVVILYNDNCTLKSHYILDGFTNRAADKKRIRFLKKYLDATNSAMFFARKIILVEGISEQILIPQFLKLFINMTADQNGCNIINVNGLAFRNFLEIIDNGYFIKCLVLTDRDTNTKSENRGDNLRQDYNINPKIHIGITTLSTFEKDIIDANKSGNGKTILLNSLIKTFPNRGNSYKAFLGLADIQTEEFFSIVEDKKSEFAFFLGEELLTNNTDFEIPQYIKDGFDFLM